MCTNVNLLSKLIKIWTVEYEQNNEKPISTEGFYRVSCKMDAIMLLLLAHANGKIRNACLQIVFDLYHLHKTILPHGIRAGEMPLGAILLTSEPLIVKQAIYAFLKASSVGHNLSSKVAASLHPLTFIEVASSNYTGLFQFYHGELVKRFSIYGRPKSLRHLAKFLRNSAVTLISQNNASASPEYRAFYASYMILLMAMAGIPVFQFN